MPELHWKGKKAVLNHHLEVPYKTLEKQYTFNAESSENKIIHGDNLEALKALLPEYEGKIKCIYIDPPYNTGNENWVYNDNVNSPQIKKWLGQVVGKESEDLTRHDKWLCMMYPRLKLLHKLLADDGVMYISINFIHEQSYLKCIVDEIFGKSNYIGELTWESTTQPINSGSARFGLQQKVEPILFYAKNKKAQTSFILKEIDCGLKYPHKGKLGNCRFEIIEKSDAGGYERKSMKFPILGQTPRDGKRWQIGEDTAIELEANNRLEIVDGMIKRAVYPEDEIDKRKFIPFWSHFSANQVGTAQTGKDLLNEILNKAVGFDTVKPPSLIEELLSHFDKNAIILDSFAGSGTTAHAVLNLNKQDGGNRKFILVEMEDYAETITAERVKRVIKGYANTEGTDGSFSFYKLGDVMLLENGNINEAQPLENIRNYIYYTETKQALTTSESATQSRALTANSQSESTTTSERMTVIERSRNSSHPLTANLNPYFLGNKDSVAYYFYYEKERITTLNYEFLASIKQPSEQYVIYADNCLLPDDFMQKHGIIFKKIPRDVMRF